MHAPPVPIDLTETFVRLDADLTATLIPTDRAFWADVMAGRRSDTDTGTVVAAFDYLSDWTTSEAHPAGDELVIAVSGRFALILEHDEGHQVVELQAGQTVVVPAGVHHHAIVHEPGTVIHVTPGAGTSHRPLPGSVA